MEDSLTEVEAKRNKQTFQSLIVELQSREGLAKSKPNPRTVSYLQFEDDFNKLKDNNLERKISLTLNTQDAFVGWSLFGWITQFLG